MTQTMGQFVFALLLYRNGIGIEPGVPCFAAEHCIYTISITKRSIVTDGVIAVMDPETLR